MIFLLFAILFTKSVQSANILCFFTSPSYSYSQIYLPICEELANRGHLVTIISPNSVKNKELQNFFQINLQDISYNVWETFNQTRNELKPSRIVNNEFELMDLQLSHPEVKGIIKNDDHDKVDLCIFEYLQPGPLPLIDIYNCPLITVSATPLNIEGNNYIGNPMVFQNSLSFLDRLNTFLYENYLRYFKSFDGGIVKRILDKHYGKTRGLDELLRESSLIFVSVNPILHTARPNVPAVIEFSGIHIKPEKRLPNDLENFMDSAKHGVIYMSFGSKINSNLLPENKIRMILNTFAELPYKVLWKFYSDNLPEKPLNVQVKKWFPQQDILRHPNLKLFITQGGLQSLDEAIYTKTPIIVIPFEGDQFENAIKVEEIGLGKSIDFSKLNKEHFKATILEVMKEKYVVKANQLYDLVEDKPVGALNNLMWWCEFVLRHKGAAHLRNSAIDMPFYIYYMLDVVGFALVATFAVCFTVCKVNRIIYRSIYTPNTQIINKQKKKQRKDK